TSDGDFPKPIHWFAKKITGSYPAAIAMDQEIVSRLVRRIAAEKLDAIVAVSPENVTYISGFVVPSQSLMRWRHAAVILTADGRLSMVAIDMEATTLKAHAGIDDLRIYREFSDDPMDKLADALKELKLERRRRDFQQSAPDQNAGRAGAAALAQQAHGQGDRRCAALGASWNQRNGIGRNPAHVALRRRRGELQIDDHRLGRAQPVSQRRAERAQA